MRLRATVGVGLFLNGRDFEVGFSEFSCGKEGLLSVGSGMSAVEIFLDREAAERLSVAFGDAAKAMSGYRTEVDDVV